MSKRTTVTLDDDVVAKLDDVSRRNGAPVRQVLNEALRRGLSPPRRPAEMKRFKVRARALGIHPGLELDNIEELLDQIEGPNRK